MENKTLLLVGGGTGGHAAPILAVYKKIKQKNPELNIMVVGVGSEEEKKFFGPLPQYTTIVSGKIHRHFTFRNLFEICKVGIGFLQSFFLILRVRPGVIFSKGGYVSLPIISVARIFKIPYYFHESDIEMGKSNRLMAKAAEKIFVCYPKECYKNLDPQKLVWSGPVLREGFEKDEPTNGEAFGFKNSKPVIFLTGGSQGSLSLSQNFIGAAKELLKHFNIIHQAGKHSIEIVENFRNSLPENLRNDYYLTDFLSIELGKDMMLSAINLADLVISRAGSTIVELAVLAKPMILIPWKHSAQDHQSKNAEFFKKHDSAYVITDDELSPEKIKTQILELFSDDKKELKNISENAKKLFPTDGVDIISNNILEKLPSKVGSASGGESKE